RVRLRAHGAHADDARRGSRSCGGAGRAPRHRRPRRRTGGSRMTNAISFITANYVAREVGWAMHGWGHGDKATNEAFAPLETYGARFGALLDDVRRLGFDTVDVWGAHLNVDWATDEHVALARTLIDERG